MHAANAERSVRLYRALEYVKSCGHFGCTTAELQAVTGSMAPATDISELRRNGYLIACDYEGRSGLGRRIYRYRFVSRKP